MNRVIKNVAIVTICASISLPEIVSAGVIQESWYLMRSRNNMEIGNYTAAIEAFEKYLELQPNDREALKGIALAYEKQGETDKAIARFDKYLEVYQDDAETAFKQANYLIWSRYAYRKKDAIKYFQLGLKLEDNPLQRLKFAQILAQDKYDLDQSVKQYEILLAKDANNKQIREEYRKLLLWDDRYLNKAIEQYEYYVERNLNDFKSRTQLAVLLGKSDNRKDDGIAIYAQLVKEKPEDDNLRRDYAKLMASTTGYFDEALKQYRILMNKRFDTDVMAEAARLLEQKKATRTESLELYSKILAREPDNRDIRLRRGAIYMDDKSTASLALKDYEYVINKNPTDAGAHRGAAEALAWLDRPDDALYHSKLARKYSKDDEKSTRLHSKLSAGREPRLISLLELPAHNGDAGYELRGARLGVKFTGDLTPYMTIDAEGGYERFEGDTDDESATWWQLGAEYRMSPKGKINFSFENRDIRRNADSLMIDFSYTHSEKQPFWSYTLGYEENAIDDSFLSLVGDSVNNIGGATRHEAYALYFKGDESKMFTFRPALGWVDSASESNNKYINIRGSIRLPTTLITRYKTSYGLDMALMSYEKDHAGFGVSAVEPLSGGYFSPQKFASILLYADFEVDLDNDAEFTIKLGPKLQLVDDASVSDDVASGFFGSMSYVLKQTETRYMSLKAEYDEVGDSYNRLFLEGQMVFVF